mgnify:CR=1 FL=1
MHTCSRFSMCSTAQLVRTHVPPCAPASDPTLFVRIVCDVAHCLLPQIKSVVEVVVYSIVHSLVLFFVPYLAYDGFLNNNIGDQLSCVRQLLMSPPVGATLS